MSSSGSSPDPEIVIKEMKRSSKDKTKKKSKHATVELEGKNEGVDPHWALKPPKGAILIDHGVDTGEFDWDAIKEDDNLELWLVRVPDAMKLKYLQGVKFEMPSSSSKTLRIGTVDRTHTSYDVWSLGEDQAETVGGQELKEFTCLLPRLSKGGKLYQAPKPVARHIILTAKPALPALDLPSDSDLSSPMYKNPPRPRYAKELLTHRFMPLGSLAPAAGSAASMEMDQVEQLLEDGPVDDDVPVEASASKKAARSEEVNEVKKKRKGDGEASKKSKKTKVAVE